MNIELGIIKMEFLEVKNSVHMLTSRLKHKKITGKLEKGFDDIQKLAQRYRHKKNQKT